MKVDDRERIETEVNISKQIVGAMITDLKQQSLSSLVCTINNITRLDCPAWLVHLHLDGSGTSDKTPT